MKNFLSFLNESVFEDFNVGDIVFYCGPDSNYKKEFGTILHIRHKSKIDYHGNMILVEFDNNSLPHLHNGGDYARKNNIKTNSSKCYYYYDQEFRYITIATGRKRIEKPEVDPFGEETWGYINESVLQDFDIGDRVYYSDKEGEKESGTVLFIDREESEILIEYDKHWAGSLHDGGEYAREHGIKTHSGNCYWYSRYSFKFFTVLKKGKKKLSNPEIDPFGEENWGYVQESFNIGDIVIYDGIQYEDRKGEEVLVVKRISSTDLVIKFKRDGFEHVCSDMLLIFTEKKKKKTDLEMDPFGEENWGYED